jgi:hypothetical protein
MPRRTALIVPVPEAEPAVSELRLEHDPALHGWGCPRTSRSSSRSLRRTSSTIPRSRRCSRPSACSRSSLAAVGRFGDDVTYLAPRPAQPFVDLIAAVTARWPEYPPYEGIHETVVPHLTLGHGRLDVSIETQYRSAPGSALSDHRSTIPSRGVKCPG